ncbi:MAG: hypothetical protein QM523_06595 [Candidatus Pacebacteria bacterium]|nr:hypothetical protein [Candidatus Paceibacterota bacterium]
MSFYKQHSKGDCGTAAVRSESDASAVVCIQTRRYLTWLIEERDARAARQFAKPNRVSRVKDRIIRVDLIL